jgi:transposase InsO family protein
MTAAEKVALVASVWEDHGLAPALAAVELPKSTWYYHRRHKVSYADKYAPVRPLLEIIAREHPAYGILRTTVELRETYDLLINHKVVQRLLQLWDLALLRSAQAPKPSRVRQVIMAAGERANLVAQMTQIGLFQVAHTDFTELRFADGRRKAYLMPIIGHTCKMAYGWAVGEQANTALALEAWEMAKATFHKHDIAYEDLVVHHDQDPVYTGYRWTGQLLLKDKVLLSYALNGAKDNPEMESFNGRFKTEAHSLFLDAHDVAELRAVVAERMHYYNTERRHSSIGYLSPLTYIERVRSNFVLHKGKHHEP